MSKELRKVLFFFFVTICLVSISVAQTQTGSINGTIEDANGVPLPGATVTVSSESLMGTQTYISSNTGVYRFPALPPGDYTIIVELPGFKRAIRRNIGVRVGSVVTIDFSMEMTSLEEEVTVTAAVPTVDLKQTKVSSTLDSTALDNLPLARELFEIVRTAPGIIDARGESSNPLEASRRILVHGTSYRESSYAFDGANMIDPINASMMATLNVDSMEEIEIISAAHPAEVGYTPGGYINIVTKSGGNKFSGAALLYLTNESLNNPLFTNDQVNAIGIEQPSVPKSWFDGSLSLGGPIIRDRIWFFSTYRYTRKLLSSAFIPFTDVMGRAHEGVDEKENQHFGFIKLTAQLSSKTKLSGMYNLLKYDNPGGTTNPYQTFEATANTQRTEDTVNLTLSQILNQNTFFDLKFTYVNSQNNVYMQEAYENEPRIRDYGTPYGDLTNRRYNDLYTRRRFQGGMTFTRFQDNFLGGNHEIKGGADYEYERFVYDTYRKDSLFWYYNNGPYYYSAADRLGRLAFGFYPPEKGGLALLVDVNRIGAFLQDSWSIGDRLTVNLGVRFDHFTGWLPAWDKEAASNPLAVWVGENVIRPSVAKNYPDLFPNGLNPFENLSFPEWSDAGVWNSIVPRFGLVYDLFGNGKTALKASYNRYSAYFLMEHYGGRHPFAPGRGWFQFYWTDTNANGQPDTSDIFDPFPVDFRYWDFEFAKRSLDPDTKSPIDEEITAGVWQEVVKDFSVGLNFLYRNSLNMLGQGVYDNASGEFWYNPDSSLGSKYWIPFTTTVPGTDEYPDQTVTAYFRSKDAPETFLRFTNIPELERKYWALELIFSKRYSQGWQLSGSIAYSKAYGNTLNQGQSAQYSSPNVFVNAYGRNDADRPLIIKLMGSVRLPLGIMFSGYFKHFSGEPWTRTASIRPPQSWANDNNVYWTGGYYETVNIEPLGSRRLRSVDILDIRFEKEFRVGDFGRLGAFIDVYNLLGWSNVNVGQNDVWRYTPSAPNVNEPQNVRLSPSYKVISSYEGLRSVNLSVRFRF